LQCKVKAMSPQETASDHLRIIRTLLERAQVYRAVSAPAALVGGVLALALATRLYFANLEPKVFLIAWLAILVITAKLNTLLLYRAAVEKGRTFVSSELKLAVRTFAPPMLAAGLLGILVGIARGELTLAAVIWVLGYGCALLAGAGFSPRSIKRLGRAFFVAGSAFGCIWAAQLLWAGKVTDGQLSCIVMGSTFGLLHVAYAAAVFLRPAQSAS
jgi:hypothetical protein